jgi:hypothetical protein
MGPNYSGAIDDQAPVLRVDRPDGSLRAVLFGAACHPVSLGGNLEVSGDYAGVAQAVIEQQNPGVQAMFMQGCGADANAEPGRGVDACNEYGNDLARAVSQVLGGVMKPISGPIQTELDWANLPLAAAPSRSELEQLAGGPVEDSYTAQHLLQLLDQGKAPQTSYNAPIALWQFGHELSLLGLSGEVVSQYASLARDLLGTEELWAAGYCNDVFGYLPSADILAQGGYECRGLVGPDYGWFAPQAEGAVLDAIRLLDQRIVTPEPNTAALLGMAMVVLLAFRRSKRP